MTTPRQRPHLAASAADRRLLTLSLLAVVIGLAAGYAAYGLYSLIALVSNLVFYHRVSTTLVSPLHHVLGAWIIIVPAIGGLIAGAMAKWGSPRIRGHGIPEAMEAVLVNQSRIAPRVAVLKPLSAAITIGTGGPFGAEGPIIQTGGAIGSLMGQLLHTTAAERKVLLACGAAAGMAATFSTPIAAVILAIELLLFEFKARSFIPLVIASTLATTVHYALLGRGPMFEVGIPDFGLPYSLPWYFLAGLCCGATAIGLTRALYFVEDTFERLPIDWIWWPVLGGIGVGLIGLFVPRVLGVGYDTISDILNGRLLIGALLAIVIFKTLALLFALGSGTSGGLLAPSLMIGAAVGGLFARTVDIVLPAMHLDPAAFALVGMAAVFGAASRATFTFIVFAFEITRDYNAVLPLMLVCVVADAVGLIFMRHSIMTEKLARRGLKVHAEFETDVLHQVAVGEVMDPNPALIPWTMPVRDLASALMEPRHELSRHHAFLTVDGNGRLMGLITRADAFAAVERVPETTQNVLEAGTEPLVVCHPDEAVHAAAERMLRHGVGRLPVVARDDTGKVLGYLGRAGVMQARMRRIREEHDRQPGWLPFSATLRPITRERRGWPGGTAGPG